MAVTIDATAGSATANSYLDVERATEILDESLFGATTWGDADPDDQARSLITATRMQDDVLPWLGSPANALQALEWPRVGVASVDSDEIPVSLERSTAELARRLLVTGDPYDAASDTANLKSLKAGSIEVDFKDKVDTSSTISLMPPLPDAVVLMVLHLTTLATPPKIMVFRVL